ncbi:MAG TPA: AmmeMemoRadiSam system protein A [Candidatus Polarisedimenticolia bacterium]|nr:AmmeMemoRadiSam system protein A [Candidatus Polarisedimenticolia bacterium]
MSDLPPGSLLTPEEGDLLLKLARRAVQAAIEGGDVPEEADGRPWLRARRDVFVTLRLQGALRGCLGTYGSPGTLLENLVQAARGAARDDARFSPVAPHELRGLRIELTLLDPPFAIAGPEAIALGRHGIRVSQRHARGLLLPQVAIEHRLDAEAFLGLACRKAGLRPDAWRHGARIEAFTAECVSEPEALPGPRAGPA